MAAPAAIDAREITLTYPNGVRALDGASLTIAANEFVAIIGPNGSGKSSLLRVLSGLLSAQSGAVRLGDKLLSELSVEERARRIALVPQTLEYLPGYTVADFVLLGRYAHLTGWRLFSRRDREIADECLARVDAAQFAQRSMQELSGGERQRVLIARALAQEAQTILLDEPTSALDLKHQLMVCKLIHDLHKSGQRTIVLVTHDLNLASQFAQRLALMARGKVAQDGPPEKVLRPEVLAPVYDAELAFGQFASSTGGGARPWVLPWAKES